MTDHAVAHHEDHHEDPMSHVPPPSFWPFLVGIGLVAFTFGSTLVLFPPAFLGDTSLIGRWFGLSTDSADSWGVFGKLGLVVGLIATFFTLMGWCHQIIKEKRIAHDLNQQQVDLKIFIKMFLISELMAFSAVFAYFYLRTFVVDPEFFTLPPGMPHGGSLVAFATFLLLSSSVTCELAHHAVMHNQWAKARILMLATLALGVIFLGFQGMEYGLLYEHGFWPTIMGAANDPHTSYVATFFIGTGFHGLHVLTGLVMLFLVYVRMELGHFTGKRHFAMIAASWYWHFVDIVWILLFITVYVV